MRIAANLGGIVTVVFYTAMTASIFAFVTPARHETWDEHQLSRGSRLDSRFGPAQSAVGLGIDLYVLVLPIIGVSKLQMPFSRKLGVAVVFMSAILYGLSFSPNLGELSTWPDTELQQSVLRLNTKSRLSIETCRNKGYDMARNARLHHNVSSLLRCYTEV